MLKGKRVIAVSNYIKKHIETRYRFTSPKLVVIDRGADLKYFNPKEVSEDSIEALQKQLALKLAKGEKLMILPSRFTRLKGHLHLLTALKYLNFKKYKCLMIGKASDSQSGYMLEIESAIKDYKLEDKVIIRTEPTNDMRVLYSMADLVISSSLEPEGFGRTIVEAQAMHKIVVSTNIGAPNDIIENGKSGFLVPTLDATTFAEVLDKALNLKSDESNKITKYAAKLVANKYSLDLMCKKTLEVYQSLMEDEDEEREDIIYENDSE
jgi:glycosyltransferase involved in cell wall biosynthesis